MVRVTSLHTPLQQTGAVGRAGLTIGQTGQMPGASRLNIKIVLSWFQVFRLFTTRRNCRAFWLLRL